MMFEFHKPDGKRPDASEVPTRVSVGGREYDVRDHCVEAPAKHEHDLAMHGFRPRRPDRVEVKQK